MPVNRDTCDGCGTRQNHCPECGSAKVTPMDNPSEDKPNSIVAYGGPDEMTYTNVCWECEWKEEVTVTFERERV